jgi:hypothetical protein
MLDELCISLADDEDFPQVSTLAQRLGWSLRRIFPRGQEQLFEAIWEAADRTTVIRFIHDHCVNAHFMVFDGPQAVEACRTVREELLCFDFQESLEMAEDADAEERAYALPFLAVLAPLEVEPVLLATFDRLASDADENVRQVLLDALGRVAWPELRAIAHKMATSDPVERIRARAERLVHKLDQQAAG